MSKESFVPNNEIPPPPVHTTNILPKSEREKQWIEFSDAIRKHLRDYTVPQYGDVGEDEITNYTVEDCVNHILRYAKRYGTQSREGQQELDFMKIAHYAQCAWEKYGAGVKKTDEESHLIIIDEKFDLFEEKGFTYLGSTTSTGKRLHVYKREQ